MDYKNLLIAAVSLLGVACSNANPPLHHHWVIDDHRLDGKVELIQAAADGWCEATANTDHAWCPTIHKRGSQLPEGALVGHFTVKDLDVSMDGLTSRIRIDPSALNETDELFTAAVMHELGHASGIWFQDRDAFVREDGTLDHFHSGQKDCLMYPITHQAHSMPDALTRQEFLAAQ